MKLTTKKLTDNQEIAKFLGFVNVEEHWWYHPVKNEMENIGLKSALNEDICLFHKSWDWLIPVWVKFRQIDVSKFDDLDYSSYQHKVLQIIGHEMAFCNFDISYKMLVSAIKWYNKLVSNLELSCTPVN